MKRTLAIAAIVPALLLGSCASDGTASASAGLWYSDYYDPWYAGGGCCVDPPDFVGPPPPRPEHPIALPPSSTPRPEHPIASPPSRPSVSPRPMPMPRPAMRGGGRR
jgi:hypothetical protein